MYVCVVTAAILRLLGRQQILSSPYICMYIHVYISSLPLSLTFRYKKNLKKLYIVHPTNFIRVMMVLFKPLIRYLYMSIHLIKQS